MWREGKSKREFRERNSLTTKFLFLVSIWCLSSYSFYIMGKATPIRENRDSAPPCTDSSTFKPYHTEKNNTVRIHSDDGQDLPYREQMHKFLPSEVWGGQETWTRKSQARKEKCILKMHLKSSEKSKGTQCLTLPSASTVHKKS